MVKSLTQYWHSKDNALQFLLEKVNHLEKMNHQLGLYLASHLAKACRVAQIKDNKLILVAKDGGIATQLRYLTVELLTKFKKDPLLSHIKTIECKVSPYLAQSMKTIQPPTLQKIPLLSPETAKMIYESAESLSDPALKAIMEKIAKHS